MFKRSITTALLLCFSVLAYAQSPGKAYTKSKIYKTPYNGSLAPAATLSQNDTLVSVQYYNGLGQPIQSIAVAGGGNRQDIVTPVVYDNWGRQTRSYLPYANSSVTTPNLSYRDNDALVTNINQYYVSKYAADFPNTASNPNPYSEKIEDSSPLSRVYKTAAPGEVWKATTGTNDHTVKIEYLTNEESDQVYKFGVSFITQAGVVRTDTTSLKCIGYYAEGKLYKTIVRNENWDGDYNNFDNTTEEYKDLEGRVVLKRTFNNNERHDTYYVYDKFGNLTYVLPPLAIDELINPVVIINPAGVTKAWTTLVKVDAALATQYNKALKDYNNPAVVNADLLATYGATGGFSVVPNAAGSLTVTINFTTNIPLPLQIGSLLNLTSIGKFRDGEIGRIEGTGYSYILSVKNNNLLVQGNGGAVPSINVTLVGGQKLSYSKNYFWSSFAKIDTELAANYDTAVKNMPESQITTTYINNPYGGLGGANISLDENDNVSFSLDITTTTPVALKEGAVFPLNVERRIADRELGSVSGDGYQYKFYIANNTLYVTGTGTFTRMNLTAVRAGTTYLVNQQPLQGLCYIYHYDHRNRMVEKHVPDRGWTQIVYDKLNRPILTQDENLRVKTTYNWLFTKYDVFGRVVYTGETTDVRKRLVIQNARNSATQVLNEQKATTAFTNNGASVHYTNTAYPTTGNLFAVNYYDNYSFDTNSIAIATQNSYGIPLTTNMTDLATGSKVRTLGTTQWTTTVTQYDDKARLIYTRSKNQFLGSDDITNSKINFAGEVLASKRQHTKNSATVTVEDVFTYDHAGRLLTQTESINGATPQLLTYNRYDELGQLTNKKVGGTLAINYLNTTGLQTLSYTYNIRGWLRKLNDPSTLAVKGAPLFAYAINYNTTELAGSVPLYNGNISETFWRTDAKKRGYSYKYDALNRLIDADYSGSYNLEGYLTQVENYTENAIAYDKQGNIQHLERYGLASANTIDKIDVLAYSYMPYSNKLWKVNDTAGTAGFNNGSSGTGYDYTYDLNGNLVVDANKAITQITYNHLDLPTQVTKTSLQNITYTYDATGAKLQKVVKDGSTTTTTQYAGGFVYENAVLQYFPHAEGYVKRGTSGSFSYVYQYKDHLGNVRLSYWKIGELLQTLQEDNYYAFGMKHQGYNNVVSSNANNVAQKIQYNGKEYQDELSLNVVAMDWRQYDPAIGRFATVDPLAEQMAGLSPYHFCYNNPVYFGDPTGLKGDPTKDLLTDLFNASTGNRNWYNNNDGTFSSGSTYYDVGTRDFFEFSADLPELNVNYHRGGSGDYSLSSVLYRNMEYHLYSKSSLYADFQNKQKEGALNSLQEALDYMGMIPLLGEPIDLLNAGISAIRGDYSAAALSLAAMVPVGGVIATVVKIQKHHIIPKAVYRDAGKAIQEAIDLNGGFNLKKLPTPFHGNHPQYNQYVAGKLEGLANDISPASISTLQKELNSTINTAYDNYKRTGENLNDYFRKLNVD